MELQAMTQFFMGCTLINGALLLIWALFFMFAPNWVYRTQSHWFAISREHFNLLMYGFLGAFKIFFLFFNLVPYLVLLWIG